MGIHVEPGPLINLCFQVQHYPFWANWAFASKTETLGFLYSHDLLIITYTSKSKNQVVHKQKFKDPTSSKCQISLERVLDLESGTQVLFPLGVKKKSKFFNHNLHNIARSDRIEFKTGIIGTCLGAIPISGV